MHTRHNAQVLAISYLQAHQAHHYRNVFPCALLAELGSQVDRPGATINLLVRRRAVALTIVGLAIKRLAATARRQDITVSGKRIPPFRAELVYEGALVHLWTSTHIWMLG